MRALCLAIGLMYIWRSSLNGCVVVQCPGANLFGVSKLLICADLFDLHTPVALNGLEVRDQGGRLLVCCGNSKLGMAGVTRNDEVLRAVTNCLEVVCTRAIHVEELAWKKA